MLNNPHVRQVYVRLGIAGAKVYDAGRLANPRLSIASLASNASGEDNQLGFELVRSFTDWLLLPARSRAVALAQGQTTRVREWSIAAYCRRE